MQGFFSVSAVNGLCGFGKGKHNHIKKIKLQEQP